ncbi:MAG: hypothetical protein V5804_15660 [Mucilaginibacter sp.]|uniref:hypothetical protein n=1 Tax=Mucilaginibacter sp. TaxID=1882438 RepID=UPI0034E41231
MGKHRVEAKLSANKARANVIVDTVTWEENGIHFHYAPALDLTGYGNTQEEAFQSFNIQIDEFLTYVLNKGTVYDELERLGWTVNKKKKQITAPIEADLLADNETYRNLITMQGINKSSTHIELAL